MEAGVMYVSMVWKEDRGPRSFGIVTLASNYTFKHKHASGPFRTICATLWALCFRSLRSSFHGGVCAAVLLCVPTRCLCGKSHVHKQKDSKCQWEVPDCAQLIGVILHRHVRTLTWKDTMEKIISNVCNTGVETDHIQARMGAIPPHSNDTQLRGLP